jgi:hypothetical protein
MTACVIGAEASFRPLASRCHGIIGRFLFPDISEARFNLNGHLGSVTFRERRIEHACPPGKPARQMKSGGPRKPLSKLRAKCRPAPSASKL